MVSDNRIFYNKYYIFNLVRKFLLSDIYTLGVSSIDIIYNNSHINDEFIFNRLILIPILTFNLDQLKKHNDNCECDECTIKLNLKITNKFTTNNINYDNNKLYIPKDIILFNLNYGEFIETTLHIKKGNAKEHSLFNHLVISFNDLESNNIYEYFNISSINEDYKNYLLEYYKVEIDNILINNNFISDIL